jgi:hypothetical protein
MPHVTDNGNIQLLSLFEMSAHPDNTLYRSRSALIMLDNIVQSLNLTSLDAQDETASVYAPRAVPSVSTPMATPATNVTVTPPPAIGLGVSITVPQSSGGGQSPSAVRPLDCPCSALSLGQNWQFTAQYTPLWGFTPSWATDWDEAELRKEESRRLVWSALSLTTAHNSHSPSPSEMPIDFHVIQSHNVRHRALWFSDVTLTVTLCGTIVRPPLPWRIPRQVA